MPDRRGIAHDLRFVISAFSNLPDFASKSETDIVAERTFDTFPSAGTTPAFLEAKGKKHFRNRLTFT